MHVEGVNVSGPPWEVTIDAAKVREGKPSPVYPKGLGILLVRLGDDIYAVRDRCCHMGCPLEGGLLEGAVLTCPCHDWRFDVRSGQFLDAPELSIPVYPTRVEDGKVLVDLAEALHG
jgi:nitrite reductase/ring-hydroxylating ferredoxin subunit